MLYRKRTKEINAQWLDNLAFFAYYLAFKTAVQLGFLKRFVITELFKYLLVFWSFVIIEL